MSVVRKALGASPLVDEVEYQQSLVETLNENLTKISMVLGVFILLMLFISFVLINNTVRLNVFSRRFTVHTMQLVGATRAFIRRPFMRGAVVQGLLSSVLALAMTFMPSRGAICSTAVPMLPAAPWMYRVFPSGAGKHSVSMPQMMRELVAMEARARSVPSGTGVTNRVGASLYSA